MRSYIKSLIIFVLLVSLLLWPDKAENQTISPEQQRIQEQIIQDEIKRVEEEVKRLLYEEAQKQKSIELTAKAESLVGTRQGQCVVAVRKFLGVGKDEVQGLAKSTKINSKTWEVGAIIVFRGMSSAGHVAVALFADSEDWLWYYDSNGSGRYVNGVWRGDEKAKIRKIKLSDYRISGYRITGI